MAPNYSTPLHSIAQCASAGTADVPSYAHVHMPNQHASLWTQQLQLPQGVTPQFAAMASPCETTSPGSPTLRTIRPFISLLNNKDYYVSAKGIRGKFDDEFIMVKYAQCLFKPVSAQPMIPKVRRSPSCRLPMHVLVLPAHHHA